MLSYQELDKFKGFYSFKKLNKAKFEKNVLLLRKAIDSYFIKI